MSNEDGEEGDKEDVPTNENKNDVECVDDDALSSPRNWRHGRCWVYRKVSKPGTVSRA